MTEREFWPFADFVDDRRLIEAEASRRTTIDHLGSDAAREPYYFHTWWKKARGVSSRSNRERYSYDSEGFAQAISAVRQASAEDGLLHVVDRMEPFAGLARDRLPAAAYIAGTPVDVRVAALVGRHGYATASSMLAQAAEATAKVARAAGGPGGGTSPPGPAASPPDLDFPVPLTAVPSRPAQHGKQIPAVGPETPGRTARAQ